LRVNPIDDSPAIGSVGIGWALLRLMQPIGRRGCDFRYIDRRLDRAGLQGRSIPARPFRQFDRIHQSIPCFPVSIWERSGRRDNPRQVVQHGTTMPVPDRARLLRCSICGEREVDFVVSEAAK
jgi:hypothetical protein